MVRDDRQVSGYIRMEQKSGLIGIYEKANPQHGLGRRHALGGRARALRGRLRPHRALAGERLGAHAGASPSWASSATVHGAITHPPDGNMLLGPAPGLKDFWCCCGAQIGIAWGPGAGKYLAQWMVHGAAEINMREFDPRRYGAFADRDYQVTKAKEDYLLRHEIPYPHLQPAWPGGPVKTEPALRAPEGEAGAVYEEIFGWERPRWFARDGIAQEDIHAFRRALVCDAVVGREAAASRERVGIMDLDRLRQDGGARARCRGLPRPHDGQPHCTPQVSAASS